MATTDRVRAIVLPLAEERGLDLYDVEQHQVTLRVLVSKEGGIDIGALTELSRSISRALDDADPVAGKYTLEVSSPGLERPLRRPDHFTGAVNDRVTGVLIAADDEGITVRPDEDLDGEERRLGYDEIAAARTLFDWGTTTKPTTKKKKAS